MKPRPLTQQQERVLRIIRERIEEGAAPTLRELGATLGITPRGAHNHLRALQAKGAIVVDPGTPRAIALTGARTVTLVLSPDEAARAADALAAAGLTGAAARLRGGA